MFFEQETLTQSVYETFYQYFHGIAIESKPNYESAANETLKTSVVETDNRYLLTLYKNNDSIITFRFSKDMLQEFTIINSDVSLSEEDIDNIGDAIYEGYSNACLEYEIYLETDYDEQIEGLSYRHWGDGVTAYYNGEEIAYYDSYENTTEIRNNKLEKFWSSKEGQKLSLDAFENDRSLEIEEVSRACVKFMLNKEKEKDRE